MVTRNTICLLDKSGDGRDFYLLVSRFYGNWTASCAQHGRPKPHMVEYLQITLCSCPPNSQFTDRWASLNLITIFCEDPGRGDLEIEAIRKKKHFQVRP